MARLLPLVLGLLAGCILQHDEETPFPPGLEPVGENTASFPPPTADDPYPELLQVVHGTADGVIYAHARGYVHAPAAAVWAALKDPEVVSDRRNTDDHQVTFGVEPEYDYSFSLHYRVDRVVTVEWDERWRYGVLERDPDDQSPTLAAIRYQKVFGTSFISELEGSMSLEAIDDQVSAIGMIENLDTIMTESDTVAGYFDDVFANIKASVRGEPLPEY